MKKRNKIIYWFVTIWLSAGLVAGGIQQILQTKNFVDIFTHLGYPMYLMPLLGIWKILGVVVILIPGYKLLKEWAYAGIFFVWSGALISHLVLNDSVKEIFPSVVLLILTLASWYFRTPERKLILAQK